MDSATQDFYFQKLQEFVFDDDKIVTVTSLSTDLNISVNTAKLLLNKYVCDHRQLKPDELAVTYILTGQLEDAKTSVYMVKEADLDTIKKKFEKVSSEIIYSIQKNKNVDFDVVSLVDKADQNQPREKALLGSIVSQKCMKRTLRSKKLPPVPPGKSFEKQSPQVKTKAATGIANLFGKAPPLKTPQNGIKEPEKETKKTPKKMNGGLSSFLSKGSSSESLKSSNKENDTKVSNEKRQDIVANQVIKDEIVNVDMEEYVEPVKESKTEVVKGVKKGKEDKPKENKIKKRSRKDNSDQPTKRRKRIVERHESDSDDLFASDDEKEEIIENSEEEPETPTPVSKSFVPKNKRRKAVDRTYEDDEGFIVTKTEYIYETASEDEEPPPAPKQEEKPKPKAVEKKDSSNSEHDISPQKGVKGKKNNKKAPTGNQPTLMSFFKKK